MSENKHTPEPWPVFSDIATTMTPDPEGTPVAILSWDDYIRARACVNACIGLDTDALEKFGLAALGKELANLQKQRDELLALLEEAVGYTSCQAWSPSLTNEIETAIASVKGGA